ncbi:MAG TPA: helix-turn-helix transcriptional regulator [Acidimicrobiales bacterium]|nr:helix-turn-helix transcriptional regulator [Acidimicrobiales bacterium]
MSQIGDRARAIREELGTTQEAIARKADVSLATVQRLEAGKHQPDLDTLIKIAGALEITAAELLGHDDAVA